MERIGKGTRLVIIVLSVLGFLSIGIGTTFNFINNKIMSSEIERVSIKAEVLDNGDFIVTENLYYNTDNINGVQRTFEYNQFDNQRIDIESVFVNGVESERVQDAYTGESGVYTFQDNRRTQQVKIYQPTEGQTTFTINYRVHGLITEYTDVQDFNWKMYDTKDASTPLALDATITFPQTISQNNLQVFGHGDVEGLVNIIDGHIIKVDITGFYQDTFAEVRVLLPNNPLLNITNKSSEEKLNTFLEYERGEAQKTNERIIENEQRINNNILALVSLLILWIVAVVFLFLTLRDIYHKYDKEKYIYELDYYREVPNYSPAIAALVLNSEHETDQAQLIATIFNLYIKKYLNLDDLNDDVKINLLKKENTISESELDKVESDVFKWLWKTFPTGEGTYKKFFNIDNQTMGNATKFEKNFNHFKGVSRNEYRSLEFEHYGGRNQKLPKSMRFFAFVFIACIGLLGLWKLFNMITLVPFVVAIILTFMFLFAFGMLNEYKNNCYQLTEEGAKQKSLVKGLKNYLNDYSLLPEAEPTAVHLWEKYFVYGLALGVTKEALNKLYQRIPHEIQTASNWQTLYVMNNLSYRYNIVHRSQTAVNSLYDYIGATTTRSSGGGASFGGGGGFSGGGGFGGGGGGSSSF